MACTQTARSNVYCYGLYSYVGRSLCIQIPDCSEVMHGGITSDLSRGDGFAEVHLAEVCEESVVHILHMVWPGIGASSLSFCRFLSVRE